MKILDLLNEGTIKVPQSTFNEVMAIICTDFFSRVTTYLSTPEFDDQPELLDIYRRAIKTYASKYGRFPVYADFTEDQAMSGSVYARMPEVDQRYFKQNPNNKHRSYTISVRVDTNDDPNNATASGSYRNKRSGKNSELTVTLPHMNEIKLVARSPELLDGFMDRLEGIVDHELQHGMQNLALNQSPDAVKYYNDDGEIEDDKYYTDESEFSPQITSGAKDFIGFIKDLRAMRHKFEPETIKQLLTAFVNPTAPDAAGIQGLRSPFFHTLYRKDRAKWKKAIKYFYGLIQNKI